MIEPKVKTIRKDITENELRKINKGDVVQVVGILSDDQNDIGRVVYSDEYPSFLKIIATRISPDKIMERPFFPTPHGIKPGSQFQVFERPHFEFIRDDNYLAEVSI